MQQCACSDLGRVLILNDPSARMPEHIARSDDPAVKLSYRREVIARSIEEWRAAVDALGLSAKFTLDAGPLGADGPAGPGWAAAGAAGAETGAAAAAGAGAVAAGVSAAARLLGSGAGAEDPGGALALTPEPALPTDVTVDKDLRDLIMKTRSADKGEVMLGLANGAGTDG